ncbi:hypothetical protein CWIS_01520 [Cellulomonas sp. A375-1]|uniref:hypothetical protein n=1 Tax=Cellulomonas sp. A375-1 TaxID=1672219 RepID=UPI000652860C|nr:hypothetical protein [Cellulomonas sp. A375-1]KMM47122.1 hypothetical protein CWIS_01520 [Cellulomonas sp. A375-1]
MSNSSAFSDRAYRRLALAVPGLVEHAWVLRDAGAVRELLLPDGRGLVQLALGAPGRLTDALTGARRAEGDDVRGLLTRAAVRELPAGAVRLGVQLHPMALSRLFVAAPQARVAAGRAADLLVDRAAPPQDLLGEAVVEAARAALTAGEDDEAARLVVAAVVRRAQESSDERPGSDEDDEHRATFAEVVSQVDAERGLVAAADLARAHEVTVSDLHRWSVRYLGVPPATYLAAVRFTGFVREAVGPGPVAPTDVVAALRWYAQSAVAPREVERFTGLSPVELRRVEERVAELVGIA